MTISYGASNRNMIRNLLTHNGEGSGILGEYIPLWNDENIKYTQDVPQNVIEPFSNMKNVDEKREWSWRMTAHPSCILDALVNIDGKYHEEIAKIVIDGFLSSVNNVLPGFNIMIDSLGEVISSTEEPVTWTLNDGTRIRNIKLKKPEFETRKALGHYKVMQ